MTIPPRFDPYDLTDSQIEEVLAEGVRRGLLAHHDAHGLWWEPLDQVRDVDWMRRNRPPPAHRFDRDRYEKARRGEEG